jgi:hypothetical protein
VDRRVDAAAGLLAEALGVAQAHGHAAGGDRVRAAAGVADQREAGLDRGGRGQVDGRRHLEGALVLDDRLGDLVGERVRQEGHEGLEQELGQARALGRQVGRQVEGDAVDAVAVGVPRDRVDEHRAPGAEDDVAPRRRGQPGVAQLEADGEADGVALIGDAGELADLAGLAVGADDEVGVDLDPRAAGAREHDAVDAFAAAQELVDDPALEEVDLRGLCDDLPHGPHERLVVRGEALRALLGDLAVGELDVATVGALEHGEAVDIDGAGGLERAVEAEVVEDLGAAGMDELAGEARRGSGVAIDEQDLAPSAAVGVCERLRGGAARDAGADDDDVVAMGGRGVGGHVLPRYEVDLGDGSTAGRRARRTRTARGRLHGRRRSGRGTSA